MIGLALGALGCFAFWFATRPKSSPSAALQDANSGNIVGHDNAGKMIANVEHYYEAPVSPASSPRQARTMPVPRAAPKRQPPEPSPGLSLGFVRDVKIDRHDQIFQFDDQGLKGLALSVLNMPAPQGAIASDLSSVFAMLTFDQAGRRCTTINRACWIGQEANEIPVAVGDTAHVLLGFPSEPCWVSFHNPNRFGYDVVERNYKMDELEPRTIDWVDWEPIGVDVRIISTAIASKGQTIIHREFQLRREGVSYSARWLT